MTYIREKLGPIDEEQWIRSDAPLNIIILTDFIQQMLEQMFQGLRGEKVMTKEQLQAIDGEVIMRNPCEKEEVEEKAAKENVDPNVGKAKKNALTTTEIDPYLRRSLRCFLKKEATETAANESAESSEKIANVSEIEKKAEEAYFETAKDVFNLRSRKMENIPKEMCAIDDHAVVKRSIKVGILV